MPSRFHIGRGFSGPEHCGYHAFSGRSVNGFHDPKCTTPVGYLSLRAVRQQRPQHPKAFCPTPPIGEQTLNCTQATIAFTVQLSINTTPNLAFRRVDAQVFKQGLPQLRVTTVIGRL